MCETKRMLYDCGHEGTHILIMSCDSGFDWPNARCNVQRERVSSWYERNERCQRCRNRNRPRVERLRTQSYKDTSPRRPDGPPPLEQHDSTGSLTTRSERTQSGSTQNGSIRSGSSRSGSTRSGSTRSGSTRSGSIRSTSTRPSSVETLVGSEKNKTESWSSGSTRQLKHEEDWDSDTLVGSEKNETESQSSRSTRASKDGEYQGSIGVADVKKHHRENSDLRRSRIRRRSGVDKHNRAWEYHARRGELETVDESCLLM